MKKRKFKKLVRRVVRSLQVQGYIENPYIFDPTTAFIFKPPQSLKYSSVDRSKVVFLGECDD
jgi:hypothetical protein